MAFDTTTNYNSFTANTKAKASEVNANVKTAVDFFNTVTSQALLGSLWENYVSTAAGHSLTSADAFKGLLINVNTSAGYAVQLPTASGNAFIPFFIKNIGLTTGVITLTAKDSVNIDDTSTISLSNGDGIGVVAVGSQYRVFNYDCLATENLRGLVGLGAQSFAGTKTWLGGNIRFATVGAGGSGNQANPYATPTNDDDTGFFFPSVNSMAISCGGSVAAAFFPGEVNINDVANPAGTLDIRGSSLGANEVFLTREPDGTVLWYSGNTNGASTGESGTAAIWKCRQDSSSSRSINAAGTINASGADYAEYMRKAIVTDVFAKGEICGVNADGLLTKSFANSIAFVLKSTKPAYVGGDTWFVGDNVDMKTPKEPKRPERPVQPPPNASGKQVAIYMSRMKSYNEKVRLFPEAEKYYKEQMVIWQGKYDDWYERMEAARAWVDRIAFSGQAPCIVNGSRNSGDYIVPKEGPNDSIVAGVVPASSITFEDYRNRVGRIWKANYEGANKALISVGLC